jgi:S-adenosylmethionine:tRNA ribosyltransferase-isomerase
VSGAPTSDFLYDLPAAAIAQEAVEPRDSARLLDADTMTDHRFADLPSLLDPGDLLVVNRTRVRRARLVGSKETGGRVEALLLAPLGDGRWEALVRPARRLRPGVRLRFGTLAAEVTDGPDEGRAVLRLEASAQEEAVAAAGEVPLPPYFGGTLDDDERYQTVYAERVGSAAAPTAGLHFTTRLLGALAERGVRTAAVDLEIGVDTFRPIAAERIEDHVMHTERFRVGPGAAAEVTAARERGSPVVAVGTTVVRALESAARPDGTVEPTESTTGLFISPGHRFAAVDRLITNFHVPGSTLVVLVAAFMGERWREAYAAALERGYRFLSFGDAMIVGRAA